MTAPLQRTLYLPRHIIGSCPTCERQDCPHPQSRRRDPNNGCPEWSTPEAAAFRAKLIEEMERAQ